jgi:hypothetical protein
MTESEAPLPPPSSSERKSRSILWYEGFGFVMIILLTWLNELFSLPYHLFGAPYRSDWRGSILVTEVVLLVWVVVHRMTRKVVERLHHLERMLRICAWCQKLHDGERWVPMEEYFSQQFDTSMTHGMCPTCATTIRADLREAPVAGEPPVVPQ